MREPLRELLLRLRSETALVTRLISREIVWLVDTATWADVLAVDAQTRQLCCKFYPQESDLVSRLSEDLLR
jgi:hypothetical protein